MKKHLTIRKFMLWALAAGLLSLPAPAANNPGDFNGDLRVDLGDFAILAANWLRDYSAPVEVPVLEVISTEIDLDAIRGLAEALDIDWGQVDISDGMVSFVDPDGFQRIPMTPVTNRELIERLRRGTEISSGDIGIQFQSFDLAAIRELRPFPNQKAMDRTYGALRQVRLVPQFGEPKVHHSVFSVVDRENRPIVEATLDTEVSYDFSVNDIPIVGPGAKVNVTYDPKGRVTQLLYAIRQIRPSEMTVQLATPLEAIRHFIDSQAPDTLEFDSQLVYYAPPIAQGAVQILLPYYDVGGIVYGPQGQQAQKLRKLIPATIDIRMIPEVTLAVSVIGNEVKATAKVVGGTESYSFVWASSSVDLDAFTPNFDTIAYIAAPRQTTTETLTVVATDTNGVEMTASQTVQVAHAGQGYPPVSGSTFGTSRGVSDLCAGNQWGFITEMKNQGVTTAFNLSCADAWERDFKLAPIGQELADAADIVLYLGHGYGGGFTFETEKDDKYLTYDDARLIWGNGELEFLCLFSCEVLSDFYDSKPWNKRWGWTFDGLHLLCGFETVAYDQPNFGAAFAKAMFRTPPMTVRQAWFYASEWCQPSWVVSAVIGVMGPENCHSGFDDYFWGMGPVSPDIRGDDVEFLWRVEHKHVD